MQEIRYFTTACRYMWILQDQDGNEFGHSAGIGKVPKHLIAEALSPEGKAKGLEIWAEHYNLMGRVGKELGFVPLDNDASFVEVKMAPRPELGRKGRVHFWITQEWYQNLHSMAWREDNPLVVDPWIQESDRCKAYVREFVDVYLVRTRTDTFKGRLHECEEWMIARRFPMMDDERWNKAMRGEVAEWPSKPGELPELTIERVR